MKTLVRTQISLPAKLKQVAEKEARQDGISMSEYIRQATADRARKTVLDRQKRAKIARELRGSFKQTKGGWAGMTKEQVYRWIRKERELSDERLKRLDRITRQ